MTATLSAENDALYIELGEKYPAAVRVGESGGDGTLIGAEWVVTAGHVASHLYSRHGLDFPIIVDGHDRPYGVRQVVVHPDFEDMGPLDLALIRLDRPVSGVSPVALYRDRAELGKEIVLVGHGDTKVGTGGGWKRDGQKRGATNVVDTVTDAHIIFDFDAPPDATSLEGTAGPGDSGGPAFIVENGRPMLAGISSLGQPGRNGPGTYGAIEHYVRVSSHAGWIDGVIGNPPAEPGGSR